MKTCYLIHQSKWLLNSVWFVLVLFLFCSATSYSACNQLDHDSLLSFSLGLAPSSPLNWSSSTDCCSWEGIGCDDKGRVTFLWLPFRGLKGEISPSLMNLTHLSHLNLSFNRLRGPLPPKMFSSSVLLETLDLSNNLISGELLPLSQLSSLLKLVDLSSNQFQGLIPPKFFQLAGNLTTFNVSHNGFSGSIPSQVCADHSMSIRVLDFSFNDFSGEIPAGLGKCSKLQVFHAGFNGLSGPIPNDIYNAAALQEASVPVNHLSGPVGDDIIRLTNIEIIDFSSNELSGMIPRDIGKLSNLKKLFLHVNNLTGFLPTSLMNCTNLTSLNLRVNRLEGNLSTFNFSTLLKLRTIDLGNNNLKGSLPSSLYSCNSLVAIRLASNQLEGQIVPDILQLESLSFLSLSINKLTNITGAIKILMGCKNLGTLIISKNFMGEEMPDDDSLLSLDGFQNVQILGLGGSNLTGRVPTWLAKLKNLKILDISQNQITGSIPSWLGSLPNLFYLDMSKNSISGEFPVGLTKLPTLMSSEINTQVNNSYMEFPVFTMPTNASFQQYNKLYSLPPAIYLGNNNLSGEIPVEIGQLTLLHVLDLSFNDFSGNIPDQISQLTNLEKLDLSGNKLSGKIPTSFKGLHFLSSFSVAYNNLQGPIPSGGQFDTFSSSSFEGNPGLCGSILQRSCDTIATSPTESPSPGKEQSFNTYFVIAGFISGLLVGSVSGSRCATDKLIKFLCFEVKATNQIQLRLDQDKLDSHDWLTRLDRFEEAKKGR
ncbi:hypothetical protein CCACVL1_16879 [Corchorus capsularis]|uniref:non-specific serine/threonine protein kinase n=1 Tax=Corchorus capsularis TaxID=210143 RepID=A0A1R3HVL6_COCAP|nr:hypothetical protein CCACVL1_16879 [Corchorus capsularis]